MVGERGAEDGPTLTTGGLSSRVRGQGSCQVAEMLHYGGHMQSMMVPLTPTQMVRMVSGPEEHEEGGTVLSKEGEEECGLEWSSSAASNSVDDVIHDSMDGHFDEILLCLPPVKTKRPRSDQTLEQRNNECPVIGVVDIHHPDAENGEEEEPFTPKDQPIITEMPQAPKRLGLLEGFWGMEYDVGPNSPMCCFEFEEELGEVGRTRLELE